MTSYNVDLFFGSLQPHAARLYARVQGLPGGREWTLRGSIRGPICRYARTLPTTVPFADMGSGSTLLSAAVIPDPCFWTPQLPELYHARIELAERGVARQIMEQPVGLRFLGVDGPHLVWQGKRWILLGVRRTRTDPAELSAWRDASAAMIVDDAHETMCREASDDGVVLIPRVHGSDPHLQTELYRLSRHAAVGVVLVDGHSDCLGEASRLFPNLLMAQWFPAAKSVQPSEWARLAFCEVGEPTAFAARVAACPLPVVAVRSSPEVRPIVEARDECDALQRDLAPGGDYAGYIV